MKDFKQIWKELASQKKATRIDHIAYCILKAMTAKTNIDKVMLASVLLEKAFTPVTNKVKLANGRQKWDMMHISHVPDSLFGMTRNDFFDTIEEEATFMRIWRETSRYTNLIGRRYCYFFIAKDMEPVQYAVQAAHVAYCLGHKYLARDPHETHFILFEVDNIRDVMMRLTMKGIGFETFVEPDMNNKITAVATEPLGLGYKHLFEEFNLLTVDLIPKSL